jgi:hypothetical protein
MSIHTESSVTYRSISRMFTQKVIGTYQSIYKFFEGMLVGCKKVFMVAIQNSVPYEKIFIGDPFGSTDSKVKRFLCSKLNYDSSFIHFIRDRIKIVSSGKKKSNFHGYHILDPSPWPFFYGLCCFHDDDGYCY